MPMRFRFSAAMAPSTVSVNSSTIMLASNPSPASSTASRSLRPFAKLSFKPATNASVTEAKPSSSHCRGDRLEVLRRHSAVHSSAKDQDRGRRKADRDWKMLRLGLYQEMNLLKGKNR